jgi:hypothetical protein
VQLALIPSHLTITQETRTQTQQAHVLPIKMEGLERGIFALKTNEGAAGKGPNEHKSMVHKSFSVAVLILPCVLARKSRDFGVIMLVVTL